jgi:biotin transport system substrate-specific component
MDMRMETRDIVQIALFAALMAVLGLFPPLMLPAIGVPITAQSMGPMLMGGILGARKGGLSMLLFILLVAIGLPLLSGGRGGLGTLIGPWSGFIYGWLAGAVVTGYLTERAFRRLNYPLAFIFAAAGGIVTVYAIGVPWYAAASGIALPAAFVTSAMVFLPGDIIKAGLAAAIVVTVRRAYPLIRNPHGTARS